MADLICGACGGELDGRYCGDCGADSHAIPPREVFTPVAETVRVAPPISEQPTIIDTPLPPTEVNPPEAPTGVWSTATSEAPPPAPPAPPTPPTPPQASPSSAPPPQHPRSTSDEHLGGSGLDSIGGLLEGGWKGVTTYVGDWIINFVVVIVILGAVGALIFIYDWIITDKNDLGGFTIETKHPIRPIELLLLLLAFVAFVFVIYGFDQAALRIARGERPIVNDVWAPGRFVPFLVMETLFISISVVSWFIPFVGPVVAWAVLLYSPYYVLDRRGSGVTAIFRSIEKATRPGRFGRQVLFGFLLSLIAYVGFGLTIIGYYVALGAGAEVWSTEWRNIAGLLLLAMWGVTLLIALACARTAAASAYVQLDGDASLSGLHQR